MRLMKPMVLMLALLLTACGFHLRGEAIMPFKSLYIESPNRNSPLTTELIRLLELNHVQITSAANQADVILSIESEFPDKQILTLRDSGRVNEYQLRYRVSFRAYDNEQREWLPADEMQLTRDYSYNDSQILAKETEEAELYQGMRSDMAQQIMRRLSHAKPLEPKRK
jgi:LPS-assembly lipoprotein